MSFICFECNFRRARIHFVYLNIRVQFKSSSLSTQWISSVFYLPDWNSIWIFLSKFNTQIENQFERVFLSTGRTFSLQRKEVLRGFDIIISPFSRIENSRSLVLAQACHNCTTDSLCPLAYYQSVRALFSESFTDY